MATARCDGARGAARLVEIQLAAGIDLSILFHRDIEAGAGDVDLAVRQQLDHAFAALEPQRFAGAESKGIDHGVAARFAGQRGGFTFDAGCLIEHHPLIWLP
ncbi:hypothetical protein MPER_15684, partial [Moniliophthora perniciosa FA553]